ncbi:MAG: replication initiation protein [Chitinophagaceae bacterium]|nr:replication initiation protein [Chitinophagaceae bacterium]
MISSSKSRRKTPKSLEITFPQYTEIYQSNRVTNSRSGSLSLLQGRIFVCLIKELQSAIKVSMCGKDWKIGELFKSDNPEMISVPLVLKNIAKPRQYHEVYDAVVQLGKAGIQLPSPLGQNYATIATLFPKIHLPQIVNGNSTIYVEIFKTAADLLIRIDQKQGNRPVFYTKYLYEVAMSARNKYTYKLYMLVSSWKSKGGFRINLDSLKRLLGISVKEYQNYREFKKRVLIPVQKDLEFKADCWFNCAASGFEERQQRKVSCLNFKIIIPAEDSARKEKADHVLYLLRTHFSFNDSQLKEAGTILNNIIDMSTFEQVLNKLQDLQQYIFKTNGTNSQVENIQPYVLQSIRNIF